MLFAIITAILAYRKAKETGRNGPLWAIIGALVFIGTQLVVSLAIGMFLGVAQIVGDWPDSIYDTYEIPATIVAIAASFLASWILLRFLGRQTAADALLQTPGPPPPPPPKFDRD